jgi:hypothetical protein
MGTDAAPSFEERPQEPSDESSEKKVFAEGQAMPLASEAEIKLWETALENRSPVIRKQAAKMLKKLTGKDYEV